MPEWRGVIEAAHIIFAIVAVFRLTALAADDAIFGPVRARFPRVPWKCHLCMSIWASATAVLFFYTVPWLNWIFAFSLVYLAVKAHMATNKETKQATDDEMKQRLQLADLRIAALIGQRNEALDKAAMWEADARMQAELAKK